LKLILRLLLLSWLGCAGLAFANDHGGGGGGGAAGLVKMDPLVINLQGGHYINFVPQLKLADPLDEGYVKGYMPALRHEMIKSLIGLDPASVQTAEFIGAYSQKITIALNKFLAGEYIKEVFFDTWMLR
jgi:flagellar basal body-associated protein FliL